MMALLLALFMKAVVPSGFMVASDTKILTIKVCAEATGSASTMHVAIPVKPSHQPGSAQPGDDKSSHCAFSSLAKLSLAAADPVLIAANIAFQHVAAFAAVAAEPVLALTWLRPPLRAPPAAF